jgi:hypothetical protein
MKKFMYSFIFIYGLIYSLWAQNSPDNIFEPRYKTVINLDKEIQLKKIPVKILFNNQKRYQSSNNKISEKDTSSGNSLNLNVIQNVIAGPDSTIYINDYLNNRIVKASKFGKYIKSYCRIGNEPGEIKREVNQIINYDDKYVYMIDDFGRRLQKFDLNMNYLGSFYNPALFGIISFGKDGNFYCFPKEKKACPVPDDFRSKKEIKTMFISDVFDTLGREINRIGKIRSNDSLVFENNYWSIFNILTNRNSNYI